MAFRKICWKFRNLIQIGFLLLPLLIKSSYARIGYFWHITDFHLDTIYSTQGDVLRSCWHIERQTSSSPARSPGRFGDYLCDSPWSLIESAAKAMKSRQGDNVEFVLWTGDGLSHSAHPMFESKKMEILRNITDLLGRTFPSQFVFPVLGHEDGTTTNFRHMGELWRHWLPSEALHTFEKGGYYSIEQTKSRLRIIALNTNFMRHDPKYSQSHLAPLRQRTPSNSPDAQEYKNYYYHHGTLHQHHGHNGDWSAFGYGYNGHHRGVPGIGIAATPEGNGARVSALSEYDNQDTEKQWVWLEEVLTKSKSNKETVYIVGHIPPGSDERHIGLQQNGHTTFTENNNKRYLDLVRKYSSIIQGQFFGHLHSDSFRIIYDDKGKPVSWMMISPSVTPRKMSVGSNNPAMRLYKFDTDSGQVLDYTQYYMDLQLANTLGEPNWVPEYNLTHYYALSDISAISLHNFVDRFTGSDGSWFSKYYRANAVRYVTDPCEGVCMLNHYCAITRLDYKEFRQCLEKEQSALRSHTSAIRNPACPCYLLFVIVLSITYFHSFATLLYSWMAYIYVTTAELFKNNLNEHLFLTKFNRILIMMKTKMKSTIFARKQPQSSSWPLSSSLLSLLVSQQQHKNKLSQTVATDTSKDLCIVQQHINYSQNPNEFSIMTAGVETASPSNLILSSSAEILPISRRITLGTNNTTITTRTGQINADDAFIRDVAALLAARRRESNVKVGSSCGSGTGNGSGAGVEVEVNVDGSSSGSGTGDANADGGPVHVALNFYRPFLLAKPYTAQHHQHCFCYELHYCNPIYTLYSISFLARLALTLRRSVFLECTPHSTVEHIAALTWYEYVY